MKVEDKVVRVVRETNTQINTHCWLPACQPASQSGHPAMPGEKRTWQIEKLLPRRVQLLLVVVNVFVFAQLAQLVT